MFAIIYIYIYICVCVCVCLNPIVSLLETFVHFSRNLLRILYYWRTLRTVHLNVLQSGTGKMSSVQTSEATATLATQCRFLDVMVNGREGRNFFFKKYFCSV
jgi:hypothetical protein